MGRNHVGNCSIDDVMTPDLDLPPADLGLPPKPMEAPLSARAWHGVQDFIAGLVGIADQPHSQPPSHPVAATIISRHWRRRERCSSPMADASCRLTPPSCRRSRPRPRPRTWTNLDLDPDQVYEAREAVLTAAVACILSGAVAGDHLTPLADTAVMAALACGCPIGRSFL